MIFLLCSVLIGSGLAYAYLNDQERFTTTASAILEIWAGNCRLACRECSDRIPASGPGAGQADVTNQDESGLCGTNRGATNCVCDACPCDLVDNLLRTYGPDRMAVADTLSNYYYYGLEVVANLYNSMTDAFGNLTSSDRQAQFTSVDRVGSAENFSFGATPARKALTIAKKKSAASVSTEEGTSRGQRSISVLKFSSDDDNNTDTNNCSRCLSQGKTCMKHCPKQGKK